MTGHEIISKSIAMLGFAPDEIEVNDSVSAAFFMCLDEVGALLGLFKKPQSLGEEIALSDGLVTTLLLGVAARIAAMVGDTAQQGYFAQDYNENLQKFSKTDTVQDTVPFAKGC